MLERRKYCLIVAGVLLLSNVASVQASYAVGDIPTGIISNEREQVREHIKDAGEVVNAKRISVVDKNSLKVSIPLSAVVFRGADIEKWQVNLQEIAKPYISENSTFGDIQELVSQVTKYLRAKGYIVAIAYLPQQSIEKGGSVIVEVALGKIHQIAIDNTSKMKAGRVQEFVNVLEPGSIVQQRDLDRLLFNLNDIPGIKAQGYLKPGEEDKTTSLTVKTEHTSKQDAFVFIDNYGSKDTGRYRIGTSFQVNQLSNDGDYLRLGFAITDKANINYDARYVRPVGSRGTHVGFAFYQTHYVLGNSWKELDANGTSRTFELFSTTPLKRTLNNNSFFEMYYRYKKLTDNIDIFEYKAEKSTHQGEIRWRGDYRDRNSINVYSLAHVFGNLRMQSADAKAGDYYGTEGGYQKTRADYMRIQRVSNSANLHFAVTGQYAWTPLDSSEKMYIGGPNAVRAYPQGEAGGDHGVLGNLELRFRLKDSRWQVGPFIDYGWVRYNKNYAFSRSLAAAGISVLYSEPGKCSIKLDYGLPLTDSYSNTAGKSVKNGQVWLQAIFKI